MPFDFCREVLFAYDMHDEVFTLLMTRKDFGELLALLKKEVDSSVMAVKKEPGNKKILSQRQYWIRKLVKYCRKINGMFRQSLNL